MTKRADPNDKPRADWKGERAKRTFRLASTVDSKLTRAARAAGLTRNDLAEHAIDRYAASFLDTKRHLKAGASTAERAKSDARQIDIEEAIAKKPPR